jgi:hypothetical protein
MDYQWITYRTEIDDVCPLRPSEYWHRQCFTGASVLSLYEVEHRQEIGIDNMMYGTDHPHSVATWGCTPQHIQLTFGTAAVPEHEARAILGGNLARLYGIDTTKLESIVGEVGLQPEKVLRQPAADLYREIPEYLRLPIELVVERGPTYLEGMSGLSIMMHMMRKAREEGRATPT